ncbi:MAG: rRNA pseudouridine synthase [Coriobacteriia bacterium]|nr:rRNA pseudouridine synthase [Coriobacteriia bacterium]
MILRMSRSLTETGPLRLQRFLARAGVASRRGSEDLMTAGRVTVNGQVCTELGTKVDPACDEVAVDGKPVALAGAAVNLILNKPAGYVTTMSDPQGRPTVAELVPTDQYPGLFPVGRLDEDTTGLLLFSTDGELAHRLLHPKWHVAKTYIARADGRITEAQLQRLRDGIELDDGPTAPARVELIPETDDWSDELEAQEDNPDLLQLRPYRSSLVMLSIHEGRKRQVRRMLSAVGHPVTELARISFGPLTLGDLAPGNWRLLTAEEVTALQAAVNR